MPDNIILTGEVSVGEGAIIQDYVRLGSRENGVVTIGENAIIRSGTVIYSDVSIGNNFKTGHNALIRENTTIGDNALVGTGCVVDGNCKIGNNVMLETGAYVTAHTIIEDDVFMGPWSVTTNDKYMRVGLQLKGPVIKRGARIGANATILPDIVVGERAVVGAGAVVTKNVEADTTVVGNPARELT